MTSAVSGASAFTTGRIVGNTRACFNDLINKYGGLRVHELLAEFCNSNRFAKDPVSVEIVQRWQRGQYMPGGLWLLQLRCFLTLAGYDDTEFKKLDRDARRLAFAIGLGVVDAADVERQLGYTPNALAGIWDITLRGRGYPDKVEKLKKYLKAHQARTTIQESSWQRRIAELLEELGVPKADAVPELVQPMVDPGLVASLSRQISATSALVAFLAEVPGGPEAVLAATREGLDIQELVALLQQLLPE